MTRAFDSLRFFVRKHLGNRCFLEQRHRENLHDFAHRSFALQFFADDGHQDVDADRDPYLRLHRVFARAQKTLESWRRAPPNKNTAGRPSETETIGAVSSRSFLS